MQKKTSLSFVSSYLITGFFFSYTLLQMSVMNSFSQYFIKNFKISLEELSYFGSIFFLGSSLSFLPLGLIFDSISLRKILLSAMFICVSAVLLFATSHTIGLLIFARAMMGVSYSAALLGCFLFVFCYCKSHITLANGVLTTLGLLGGALAQTPIIILTHHYGWQHAMLCDAMLGGIILVLMYFFLYEPTVIAKTQFSILEKLSQIKRITCHKLVFFCAVYACLLNSPNLFLGDLWGTIILTHKFHFNEITAANIITYIFIGMVIGCSLLAGLVQYMKNKRLVMLASSVLLLVLVLPLIMMQSIGPNRFMLLFFSYGILISAQALVYPLMSNFIPAEIIGITTGFLSTFIMLGNAILQSIFAKILSINTEYSAMFSLASCDHALLMIPISAIICAIIALLIPESPSIKKMSILSF